MSITPCVLRLYWKAHEGLQPFAQCAPHTQVNQEALGAITLLMQQLFEAISLERCVLRFQASGHLAMGFSDSPGKSSVALRDFQLLHRDQERAILERLALVCERILPLKVALKHRLQQLQRVEPTPPSSASSLINLTTEGVSCPTTAEDRSIMSGAPSPRRESEPPIFKKQGGLFSLDLDQEHPQIDSIAIEPNTLNQMTFIELTNLAYALPYLQTLQIHRVCNLEALLFFLSKTTLALVELDLSYWDDLSETDLAKILARCPALTCLVLAQCRNIRNLPAIAKQCPNLQELYLDDHAYLTAGDVIAFCHQFASGQLRIVNLEGCSKIDEQALAQLVQKYPQIRFEIS